MSSFVKTTSGARIIREMIGAVTLNGTTIFVNDRSNSLIVALKFDDVDDAQLELTHINEQLDAVDEVQPKVKRR